MNFITSMMGSLIPAHDDDDGVALVEDKNTQKQ